MAGASWQEVRTYLGLTDSVLTALVLLAHNRRSAVSFDARTWSCCTIGLKGFDGSNTPRTEPK